MEEIFNWKNYVEKFIPQTPWLDIPDKFCVVPVYVKTAVVSAVRPGVTVEEARASMVKDFTFEFPDDVKKTAFGFIAIYSDTDADQVDLYIIANFSNAIPSTIWELATALDPENNNDIGSYIIGHAITVLYPKLSAEYRKVATPFFERFSDV
jgi:hypothetical protein